LRHPNLTLYNGYTFANALLGVSLGPDPDAGHFRVPTFDIL
jgi:hypothetical protein